MKYTLTILALAAAVSAFAQPEMRTDEDGVLHVLNPETPLNGASTVELQELWRAGGDDEDLLIGFISDLFVSGTGEIYALDSQLSEVQVFSPDGAHLRTIGREGEGPGEFRNGSSLFPFPGDRVGVIQSWPGKIVLLETDGTPGPMFPLSFNGGAGFQIASRGARQGDRVVLSGSAWTTREGEQRQLTYLMAFDASGAELARFHQDDKPTTFGGNAFEEKGWTDFQRRWAAAPDGRVAAALSFDDYRIHVWNADGSLDRVIERPGHRTVVRDDREREIMQTLYDRMTRWNPGSTFEISDTHQAVAQLLFREDGSLWVQSGRDRWRPEAGTYTSYDVYDVEGRFVRRVRLVADADPVEDALFLAGDRAYLVTDMLSSLMMAMGAEDEGALEEPEPVSIVAYRAALPVLAADADGADGAANASP